MRTTKHTVEYDRFGNITREVFETTEENTSSWPQFWWEYQPSSTCIHSLPGVCCEDDCDMEFALEAEDEDDCECYGGIRFC